MPESKAFHALVGETSVDAEVEFLRGAILTTSNMIRTDSNETNINVFCFVADRVMAGFEIAINTVPGDFIAKVVILTCALQDFPVDSKT